MEWINTNDKLPEVGTGGVLAMMQYSDECFQMVVNYDEDGWIHTCRPEGLIITHWMPLPEPPNLIK